MHYYNIELVALLLRSHAQIRSRVAKEMENSPILYYDFIKGDDGLEAEIAQIRNAGHWYTCPRVLPQNA